MESLALVEPLLPDLRNQVLIDLAPQLLARIRVYLGEEIVAKRLLPGSDRIITEVFKAGELERGKAASASGYQERQGRKVLKRLIDSGLLVSDTPKGAVRVGFPSTLLERYFPQLFLG